MIKVLLEERALTVQETAEFLQSSEDGVLEMIHGGELPASNIGKGDQRPRWRVMASDLCQLLIQRRFVNEEQARPKRRKRRVLTPTKDYFGE